MSRITKEIAKNVAKKLLEKKQSEIDKIKDELANTTEEIYLRTVPKEIMEVFIKYPDFVRKSRSLHITGQGMSEIYVNLINSVPVRSEYNNIYHSVKPDEAEILIELNDKLTDLKLSYKTLSNNISETLFNLRTYNKVQIDFPEAYELLPDAEKTGLMINIEELRKEIAA